jgi:hypothetical protein
MRPIFPLYITVYHHTLYLLDGLSFFSIKSAWPPDVRYFLPSPCQSPLAQACDQIYNALPGSP